MEKLKIKSHDFYYLLIFRNYSYITFENYIKSYSFFLIVYETTKKEI